MGGLCVCLRRWAIGALLLSFPSLAHAQGLQLFGIGPVNRSMGGAATAAPIEAIGALAYNPATLSALPNQLGVAAEFLTPPVDISSSLAGNSGNTASDPGWTTVPAVGLSWRPQPDSPMTFGFGLFGVAGYSLNYPASTTNPILFPQTPTAGTPTPGFGNIYADVAFLEIAPTIAWQLTDQLAVAAGPTVMSGRLLSTPFAFTAPNDANGDGVFTYPVGSGTHFAWGLGFQVGAYWKGNNGINLGASFKSRQWFQNFKFHGTDELGLPQNFDFHFDYPMIISLGTSYTGIERLLLACDVRYMDWSHTETVGDTARFGADGRLLGLGWDSTWSVSLGAQYELTPVFTVRAGYAFSESPIKNDVAFFNVGSPLILQHAINAGGTMKLSERFAMHFAYYYAPEADVSGPFHTPAGPVAGSNVNYRVTAHAVSIGMTVQF